MQVVKYFFEEPVALEMLSSDNDPDARRRTGAPTLEEFLDAPTYARGYLAASDLETGRIAASVLPESIAQILHDLLPAPRLHFSPGMAGVSYTPVDARDDLREALTDAAERSVIVCGGANESGRDPAGSPAELTEIVEELIERDVREALATVTALLDAGHLVLISEPSHDGHDWSVFSPRPLAAEVRVAMAEHFDGISGYVIPFRKARAEHRFYFEQVDPEVYREFQVTG